MHSKPFRVNRILRRRHFFPSGDGHPWFALTCNPLGPPLPEHFSDTTRPLEPFLAWQLCCTRPTSLAIRHSMC